jgi:hypothetical protein
MKKRGTSARPPAPARIDDDLAEPDLTREQAFLRVAEDLRGSVAEIDARAYAADELFHRIPWTIGREQRRDLGRVAYLLGDVVRMTNETLDESERRLQIALRLGVRAGTRTRSRSRARPSR